MAAAYCMECRTARVVVGSTSYGSPLLTCGHAEQPQVTCFDCQKLVPLEETRALWHGEGRVCLTCIDHLV